MRGRGGWEIIQFTILGRYMKIDAQKSNNKIISIIEPPLFLCKVFNEKMLGKVFKMDGTLARPEHGQIYHYLILPQSGQSKAGLSNLECYYYRKMKTTPSPHHQTTNTPPTACPFTIESYSSYSILRELYCTMLYYITSYICMLRYIPGEMLSHFQLIAALCSTMSFCPSVTNEFWFRILQ